MSFADLLYDSGVLRFGDFRLKSGKRSPFFLNFGELHTGAQFEQLGRSLADCIMENLGEPPQVVLGPPYKAISMAAVTVNALWNHHRVDSGFMTFRKESKAHGEGGDFLGHRLVGGESVVLVDDVMSSGQTKVEAMELLSKTALEMGLEPPSFTAVVVGVDRQEREGEGTAGEAFTSQTGVPLYSVANIRELTKTLEPRLKTSERDLIGAYLG